MNTVRAFCDDADLYRLTGYRRAAEQIAWLRRNGVPHMVNARGKPVVRVDVLDARPLSEPELGPVR